MQLQYSTSPTIIKGRYRSYIRTSPIDRFWSKVSKTDSCWLWLGKPNNDGYGKFWITELGRSVPAHHFSWEIHNSPIPDDLCVLHTCDNPPCVRPDHLFLGTRGDNNRDRSTKGRS